MGLPVRTFEEGRQYAISHKKGKNELFFSNESANMAWILGFLASDGSIGLKNNTIKIGLSRKDKEILEKIKQELDIENEIHEYVTNKGFDVVELSWTCQQHKQDLAKYGIIPQKTFYLTPPLILNEKYWLDYLRGYFDGDGNICQKQNGVYFTIGSCTREILEWIINFLYNKYDIPRVNINIDKRGNHNYYYFSYSTNASKKIYELLYKDSNSLRLERKFLKYSEIIKK